MAEDSAFWGGTTVGDAASADVWQAPYTSEEWSDIWSKMFASDSTSGFVIPLHENELAVEAENPASMDVSVLSGVAAIRGRLYENTTTASLTIGANASGSPRIDRIILRTSFAAQTIRLAVLQGTPGATPALPTLTQDANTWEISLAYIWVANGAATIPDEEIHDERVFLKTSLSHKYEAGSQNLIKNSEFMGFSELSGGATTNPPDGWSLEATPSDIASATKYSGMPRGRAVQITTNAASEGIYQSVPLKSVTPYILKIPVKVTAGDVGVVRLHESALIVEYSYTNYDTGVLLRTLSGAGGSTSNNSSSSTSPIGNLSGTHYRITQSFQVTAGRLSGITFDLGANSGSPVGTITWQICSDNAGNPGTVLQTATHTPTASSTNTITVVDGVYLAAATSYWLILYSTESQASNVYWTWERSNVGANPYANGLAKYSTDGGATWVTTSFVGTDMDFSITTVSASTKDKLSQSIQVSGTQLISSIRLYLRKIGSPVGTMTLRVETDAAGIPSGNLVDAAATTTLAESSLSTTYSLAEFIFSSSFSISGSTSYWLVLSTDRAASGTNYVFWGADSSAPSYANGEMKSEVSATWGAENKDGCFDIYTHVYITKYIRITGSFVEESVALTSSNSNGTISINLLGLNNGDIIQFGQCLFLEGRHPGPFREIHETILFKDGITDSNWAADAKSDGTTTIDLDSDFQGLVLPGTRRVLVGLKSQDTTSDIITSYAASNQNTGVELQGAAGIDRIAQSFQIAAPASVQRIQLYLKKTGAPTYGLVVYLETNAAGSPSGTLVHADAYSTSVSAASLITDYVMITFKLQSPISLSAATTYWIDLVGGTGDAVNFVTWGADSSAPGYASGEMKSQNGGVWSAESKDGCFKVRSEGTSIVSSLAARIKGSLVDAAVVSLKTCEALLDYYAQGWVEVNSSNQFDLYVVDTTAGSILCTAEILGIEI